MVVYACNHSPWEVKKEDYSSVLSFDGQSGLHETLSQNKQMMLNTLTPPTAWSSRVLGLYVVSIKLSLMKFKCE